MAEIIEFLGTLSSSSENGVKEATFATPFTVASEWQSLLGEKTIQRTSSEKNIPDETEVVDSVEGEEGKKSKNKYSGKDR